MIVTLLEAFSLDERSTFSFVVIKQKYRVPTYGLSIRI